MLNFASPSSSANCGASQAICFTASGLPSGSSHESGWVWVSSTTFVTVTSPIFHCWAASAIPNLLRRAASPGGAPQSTAFQASLK